MKILYVLNSGKPGGMEQHVLDLVKTMNTHLNRVYVWCRQGEIVEWYKDAGAEVTTGEIKFDIDPLYIYDLYKFLKEEKIDVVHAHELKAAVNAVIAAKLAGVKAKITHTHTPVSTWKISPWKIRINTVVNSLFINLCADKEVALTESRKRIKMKEGVKESKLVVIPNALETDKLDFPLDQKIKLRKKILDRYKIPDNAFVFGNVSRLSEEKGHLILVEAFKRFMEFAHTQKNDIYLLMAGGGVLESELREKIREYKLEEHVVITGIFSAEDLVKFYNTFDAFIFPTLTEGFGLVLIEAMYSRLPIVCSDLEVLQEVGGSTVYYFETGNPEDLSQKMLNLYQRKGQFDQLTRNARERVLSLYTVEKYAESYKNLYLNLLEKK